MMIWMESRFDKRSGESCVDPITN